MMSKGTKTALFGGLLITAALILGFIVLYRNTRTILAGSDPLVLNASTSADSLSRRLLDRGIFQDPDDAEFTARWITSRLREGGSIPNLGALNKNRFRIPADSARVAGKALGKAVASSERQLGLVDGAALKPFSFSPEDSALTRVSVLVLDGKEGVPGVRIRVRDHSTDKAGANLGFILTDSSGTATVSLPSDGHFSFLPLRQGYEYGAPRGTLYGPLEKSSVQYTFRQRIHTIRPLDPQSYRTLKEGMVLSVRTSAEFFRALLFYPCVFIAAWWLLLLFLLWYDRRRNTGADYFVPLTLMALSGIGLLSMFSIVNPLTDTLLGAKMTWGAVAGILALGIASCADWDYFYHSRWFDPVLRAINWTLRPLEGLAGAIDKAFKNLVLSLVRNPEERLRHWARSPFSLNVPKGTGYLIIALLFILLLQLLGSGPEGSGTKVNLFFFQPSELNKYLVVVFMAAFFAVRADRISLFSEVADSLHLRLQLKAVLAILLCLAVLLVLYMVVLSDLGPALVIIVTFILLYSIARKDFVQLLIGIATFLGMVWIGGMLSGGSLVVRFFFALGWLGGWILFWRIKEKRLYESAIFFNFLLSAFIFLGGFLAGSGIAPLRNAGQRIQDRNEVAANMWDNDVRGGGDQVVQGIWSLASGGLTGQGPGKGNPNLVPAFHTDMVFTSIGEEMGWLALVVIILCFAVLIHRSLVTAYNSGSRFLFFFTGGIAIATGVQFFVIVFGSIGIIPLTGVSVPFLSFGMTSLIINLAAFGIVLSASRVVPTENQMAQNRPYRHVTAVGIASFLTVSLVLAAILFTDQVLPVTRNRYLVKPAYIANRDGYRIAEYNPRIRLLLKEMKAGNLLDRNGLLLATSDPLRYSAFISDADSSLAQYLDTQERDLSRYYPFGNHTFFLTGDFNTQTLWGIDNENPYGFLAEERLLDRLRGFTTSVTDGDNRPVRDTVRARTYYPSPFSAPVDTAISFNRKDYSPLLEYLRDGIHSRKVQAYNQASMEGERDVSLTVDARLQTILQGEMASFLENPKRCTYNTSVKPKLRASVVILDAEGGDVLASANYPLPDQKMIRDGQNSREDYLRYEKEWANHVYTDRDLGTTFPTPPGSTAKTMSAMAAFVRDGAGISGREYDVRPQEQIHTSAVAVGSVSMKTAIVHSSNCYFINLVNDEDLYPELEEIYRLTGATLGTPTYTLYRNELDGDVLRERERRLHSDISGIEKRAVDEYLKYREKRARGQYEKMTKGVWQLPWGQSPLEATPLAMARVASVAYNGGVLPETRWLLDQGRTKGTRILDADEAAILKEYMIAESAAHTGLPSSMGGKTGTPERERQFSIGKKIVKYNDAWYIFFAETEDHKALAVAVRLERIGVNANGTASRDGSGRALDFVRRVVVPAIRESGYNIE